MDRAGFSKNDTKTFKTVGMNFDFYLEQKMEKPHDDAKRRVRYPFDLDCRVEDRRQVSSVAESLL